MICKICGGNKFSCNKEECKCKQCSKIYTRMNNSDWTKLGIVLLGLALFCGGLVYLVSLIK